MLPKSRYDYFENERYEYLIHGVHVTIDRFPFLPYCVEIEASSKAKVYRTLRELKIRGVVETGNRATPTWEYYKRHGADYSKVSRRFKTKLARILTFS